MEFPGSGGQLLSIGHSTFSSKPPQRGKEKETTQVEKAKVPGLEQWSYPPRDEQAIKDSLAAQAKRRIIAEVPSEETQESLLEWICEQYPPTSLPPWYGTGGKINEAVLLDHIHDILDHRIKPSSGPGVPLSRLGASNAKLLETDRSLVVEAVLHRFNLLTGKIPDSPEQILLGGFCDPVRLFVKSEPHNKKKFLTKRWRLIANLGLVDIIIEKLLFDKQNKREIANWRSCPSTPGINLSSPIELKAFGGRIMKISNNLETAASADVTGFDWSVQEWELYFDAKARLKLMNCPKGSLLERIIFNRIKCLCRPVYVLPSGDLLQQTHPGVQKSGSNNTSSTNSRIRVALARLAGARWAVANGDDCIEEFVEDAEKKYLSLGHPLKMYDKCNGSFSFCSTIFIPGGGVPYPEDGTKTLFNLLENKVPLGADLEADPYINQFEREMEYHPRREEFQECYSRAFASPEDAILYDSGNPENVQETDHNSESGDQRNPHLPNRERGRGRTLGGVPNSSPGSSRDSSSQESYSRPQARCRETSSPTGNKDVRTRSSARPSAKTAHQEQIQTRPRRTFHQRKHSGRLHY